MSHKQGFRVELAPDVGQAVLMGRHCGLSRVVENFCLETIKKKWAQRKAEESYGIPTDQLTAVEPWYQRGVVPDTLAKGPDGRSHRVGPDVAMVADGATGMLVGGTPLGGSPTTDPSTWQYTELGLGGTSLAALLFAAVQALAQQARGGKRLGFANPALYQRAGSPAIRDIDKYLLPDHKAPVAVRTRSLGSDVPVLYSMLGQMPVTPPNPLIPWTGPGFDTETGVGVPTGSYPLSFAGT